MHKRFRNSAAVLLALLAALSMMVALWAALNQSV